MTSCDWKTSEITHNGALHPIHPSKRRLCASSFLVFKWKITLVSWATWQILAQHLVRNTFICRVWPSNPRFDQTVQTNRLAFLLILWWISSRSMTACSVQDCGNRNLHSSCNSGRESKWLDCLSKSDVVFIAKIFKQNCFQKHRILLQWMWWGVWDGFSRSLLLA